MSGPVAEDVEMSLCWSAHRLAPRERRGPFTDPTNSVRSAYKSSAELASDGRDAVGVAFNYAVPKGGCSIKATNDPDAHQHKQKKQNEHANEAMAGNWCLTRATIAVKVPAPEEAEQ